MFLSRISSHIRSLRSHYPSYLRQVSTNGAVTQSSEDYCLNLVRTKDYEGFLAGLLFPSAHRRAYFAIKAYNVEIATIRDQIPRSAETAGKLRFQFWRDVLSSLSSKEKKLASFMRQPVAFELQYLAQTYPQMKLRWLERSLEAR
jgi:NADH dehydrogenase [ubiquinone] 1 alpha subcomplex assembly factor 6